MSERVLDSSVILAIARGEPVFDWVPASVSEAIMSTVNVAEVLSKASELGSPASVAIHLLLNLLGATRGH